MKSADIAGQLAQAALEIKAIKFSVKQPFCWASGYYMPIYNDNRMLLGSFKHRALIVQGLKALVDAHQLRVDVVAGVATAGIPAATSLADYLQLPLVYIRQQSKDHGLKNRVEGILEKGSHLAVIEDVVSTGGSCLEAVEAVREAGGIVNSCLCIFSYDFPNTIQMFQGKDCELMPLLNYQQLLSTAKKANYLDAESLKQLELWQQDPFGWGDKHGFPKRVK